jgi:hypothetical protein
MSTGYVDTAAATEEHHVATAEQVEAGEAAGTIAMIELAALNVDEIYQRDVDHRLINRIAREWDPAAAGTIVIGRRPDGSVWIVDGQHRVAGAAMAGVKRLRAQIIDVKGKQHEAKLRLKGNDRRPDSAQEKFRAKVAAEDETALAIQRICNEFETMINYSPNASTGINCVAAIEKLYEIDKGVTLVRVLEVIQDAFGSVSGQNVSVNTLQSVHWFLKVHHEANKDRFVDVLRKAGVPEIDRKARSHRAAQGGTMWLNYYRAIVELYNAKLPATSRLMWRTTSNTRMQES